MSFSSVRYDFNRSGAAPERGGSGGFVHHWIDQCTHTLDFNLADIAGFHIQRRFPREADSGWSAGDDDVAALQSKRFAQRRHQSRDIEYEIGRGCILQDLSVEPSLKPQ